METPISFIHQTSDGPVHLLVKNSKLGWDSFHWERNLGGAWTFNTLGEANQYVLDSGSSTTHTGAAALVDR
jgi:hypothetical protein